MVEIEVVMRKNVGDLVCHGIFSRSEFFDFWLSEGFGVCCVYIVVVVMG